MRYLGLLETYKEYLPVTDKTPKLTLQEGIRRSRGRKICRGSSGLIYISNMRG